MENISAKTGIKKLDVCYWNNGIVMLNKMMDEEHCVLYAAVNSVDGYYSMKMGNNVYDGEDKGKIVIYNEDEKEIMRFGVIELTQKIGNEGKRVKDEVLLRSRKQIIK